MSGLICPYVAALTTAHPLPLVMGVIVFFDDIDYRESTELLT
jgi:hypothetical protein